MKIGSKIALFYTLISVLTTVIIIAVFYIFSTQYINKLYASYLREKAYLTAQKPVSYTHLTLPTKRIV